MRILAILFIISLISLRGNAQDAPAAVLPVEWQRVELQEKLTSEIEKSLGAIIEKNKFLVQVNVTLSEAKSFGPSKSSGENFALDKLGINKDSKAYKNALTVNSATVFDRIGGIVVTLTLDQSVREDQNNQAKRFIASIVQSYTNKNPNVRVNQLGFLKIDGDQKTHEKNLEVANVSLQAAEKLALAIRESNAKLSESINAMNTALAGKDTTAGAAIDKQETKKLPTNWQGIVLEFKMEIIILLTALLVLMFISGFKSIEGQKVALMAQSNRQAKEAADAALQAGSQAVTEAVSATSGAEAVASSGGGGGDSAVSTEGNGFTQFKNLIQQYPQTGAYFIKLWLNMGTQDAFEAVATLPKMLSIEALAPIYASLGEDFKKKLRKVSSMNFAEGSASRADTFIVQQLVNDFLINTIELPDEVKALTSSMSVKEYVECMTKDDKLATVFMNILQADQLGRILQAMPEDSVGNLFEMGLKFKNEDISYLSNSLGKMLDGMRKDSGGMKVPLVDKSQDLVRILGPSREKEIFEMLSAAGDNQALVEAATNYFPAELILKLPVEMMRFVLNQLKPDQRAELIFSRPIDEQSVFLKALGDSGKMREMIDMELEQIKKNDKKKAQIQKDQDVIWSRFVQKVRASIRTSPQLKVETSLLLKKWLEDKGVESGDFQLDSAA